MCLSVGAYAQRSTRLLNDNWKFRFSHQVKQHTATAVAIPHTWNAQDALSGKIDYKRGIGNYERKLHIAPEWEGKRLFLRFEGVNSIANVFINGKHIGEHRGGYSAFIFEITDLVNYGKDNALLVRVNNAEQLDIMPLVGDFNFYGGIYRDVSLLITDALCISPLDYASPGVYLTQNKVSEDKAEVAATLLLSNRDEARRIQALVEVKEHDKVVCRTAKSVKLDANAEERLVLPFSIDRPHLWNGTQDPFMYQVEVTLRDGDKVIDKVVQPL